MLDIDLTVPPTGTPLDGPLAQLLDLVNGQVAPTLAQVLALLQQNGGAIEIPGLGRLELGYARTGIGARQAAALALSLRVTLYGVDGVAGTADDSTLKVGRSYARILADMPYAVMSGAGWAADADLAGGTAHVGNIVPKLLPCQGTDGQTRTKALAAATLPGVSLGGLQGRASGKISRIGKVRAWTEGSVAHVSLGSGDTTLTVDGIVGRVNLVTDRRGRIVRRDIEGTIPGVLTFQGQSYDASAGCGSRAAARARCPDQRPDRGHRPVRRPRPAGDRTADHPARGHGRRDRGRPRQRQGEHQGELTRDRGSGTA